MHDAPSITDYSSGHEHDTTRAMGGVHSMLRMGRDGTGIRPGWASCGDELAMQVADDDGVRTGGLVVLPCFRSTTPRQPLSVPLWLTRS